MKQVYVCFSTDVLHGGHLNIIHRARELGEVTVGMLTDEVIATYKRFPILSYDERRALLEDVKGVERVVPQTTMSYRENLLKYKPDFVLHGDDWVTGPQAPVREEAAALLKDWGGQVVDVPFSHSAEYERVEKMQREQLSMPDVRRGRLRQQLAMTGFARVTEVHSGLSGLIAEKTVVNKDGGCAQFDGMWMSSLCDSIEKGKPDIELLDMSSRLRTVDDVMEVTTKPIIFDGDTGGQIEHFVYNIRTMERMGVSAVIIEDKKGLKKNSLFGTAAQQTQDSIEDFSKKISAGKRALKTRDFMLIARIESLILEQGMDDALKRAAAFTAAGADGIMIHSKKKEPDEIIAFCKAFRAADRTTPLVIVPTTYNTVTEKEWRALGVNIVIYANHLTRMAYPAMKHAAESILEHGRCCEIDRECMSIKEILTLIPTE